MKEIKIDILKIALLILFAFIGWGTVFIIFDENMNSKLHNIIYTYSLEKYVTENNLIVPFPDFKNSTYYINSDKPIEDFFKLDFESFTYEIQRNFIYDDLYDCKYWTYIWVMYWFYNYEKYNWKLDIETTDNHVYVKVYNESGYCILDQDNVFCLGVI